jgi:hypothetical protein
MAQRQQLQANRLQAQNRMAQRQQLEASRLQQAQNMRAQRMQQAQAQMANRQQLRFDRQQQLQTRLAERQQLQARRAAINSAVGLNSAVGFGVGGCPPGLANKGCMPPGLAMNNFSRVPAQERVLALRNLGETRFIPVDIAPRRQFLDPIAASALIGVPLASAATVAAFNPFPAPVSFLYPATPNYYYQYGDGYAYQIDRGSNLIDALIPLLAGGYLPGSYLPSAYMSSYVPSYYGFNSFYPADYGFGGLCNRYAYGVVYQVDCVTGMVENVIPMYAGGYGVGQLLPSAYATYNVPYQYRNLYYNTPDYGYYYAPGAIYQYDRGTDLITSVAALMSPGFTIGQPLPAGYGVYNVPYAYRSTYFDTPTAMYRYNNGYIYQIDPSTMLVSAIVASLLT